MKPDIAAPGGNILSTWPLDLQSSNFPVQGYHFDSGTSMAAPHTAGCIALLLQALPGLDAGQVKDIIQTTAVPQPFTFTQSPGTMLPVNVQVSHACPVNRYCLP